MSDPGAGLMPGVGLAVTGETPAPGAACSAPGATCLRPGGLELTERIVGLARLPRGARVLDVGCGRGATVAHLTDRLKLRPVGIDASPAQIARARAARPDLDFAAGRAEDLPFAAGAFDAVLAECLLSTLPDARAALREMVRVLSDGGCVVVTDLYDRGDHHVQSRATLPSLGRREAVEALLAGAGLEAETWEDHTAVLARLFWDMATAAPGGAAGRAQAITAPPPAGRAGRRLGYFACVARAREGRAATSAATTRAKGAHGARS
jgi:SAM-dependent methyltransferase